MLIAARESFAAAAVRKRTPTARDYIQNGLVALFDGIENAGWGVHDPSATTWKDLVGTNDIALLGSGWQWLPNGIIFPTTAYGRMTSGINVFPFTMEIVASVVNSNSNLYVYGNNGASRGYVFQQNFAAARIGGSYRIMNYSPTSATEQTYAISAVYGTTSSACYNRGALSASLSYSGSFAAGQYTNTIFGFQGGNNTVSRGTVHTLRHYSRALTAAEVAANFAIDKERFGL